MGLLLVAVSLAGCVDDGPEELPAPVDGDAYWGRPLADHADTPSMAATDSRDERRSAVVPPGDPRYAALDAAMKAFMLSHDTPSATVAVLIDGKLRYAQGFGFLDQERTQPTPPDAMMRIASITKPMTAAVIDMLVQQGRIAWDDRVFCLDEPAEVDCRLSIAPAEYRPMGDDRLGDLTVRHLIDHQTGWTRETCDGSLFYDADIAIADAAGIPRPPPAWRHVQWHMGAPMDFDPGTGPGGYPGPGELDGYCNTGYLMLGLIAEAATDTALSALYDAYLWRPLQVVGDIEPARSLPEFRNPREPFYKCDNGMRDNVYPPHQQVCAADGGISMEIFLPLGGLTASAEAVATVFHAYANDGGPNDMSGPFAYEGHNGGWPGTATSAMRFTLGVPGSEADGVMVVLFNSWSGRDELPPETHVPYELQLLYNVLLGAVAQAEGGWLAGSAPISQV